jgi:hypothetical protein
MIRPQPLGFRCPRCGATNPNPQGTVEGDAGDFRAVTQTIEEKLCEACRVRTGEVDADLPQEHEIVRAHPGEFDISACPHDDSPLDDTGHCMHCGRSATRAARPIRLHGVPEGTQRSSASDRPREFDLGLVGMVASRVPSVTLAFGHRQDGDVEISAACTGCRTDLGLVLRVPARDLTPAPAVLEHIAGRIAERVNELHCEHLRGDAGRAMLREHIQQFLRSVDNRAAAANAMIETLANEVGVRAAAETGPSFVDRASEPDELPGFDAQRLARSRRGKTQVVASGRVVNVVTCSAVACRAQSERLATERPSL